MNYKEFISDFYEQQCKKYGDVGWQASHYDSDENQYGTFVNLMKIVSGNGTLLDVGCGQGDLFEFIETRGIYDVTYHGIDLCPTMIGYAKSRFPDGNFIEQDLLTFEKQYDYVIGASVMNLDLGDLADLDFERKMIEKMFKLAKRGVAFNMLSDTYEIERQEDLGYEDPGSILSYCLQLTPNIYLDHHCSGYDFCVYMYK